MRAALVFSCVAVTLVTLCAGPFSFAETPEANPQDIADLLRTFKGAHAAQLPQVVKTDQGYVRYLAAPRGTRFVAPMPGAKSAGPKGVALHFVDTHRGAFGLTDPDAAVNPLSAKAGAGRTYVRLQQTYGELDVFAAQMIVQLDASLGVTYVVSDIMRDTSPFDNGSAALTPSVAAAAARQAAIANVASLSKENNPASLVAEAPVCLVYDPAVIGLPGSPCLAWKTVVTSTTSFRPAEVVLVDAHTGEVAFHYSLICQGKYREIYDGNNQYVDPGTLVRSEGEEPSGIVDADLAYDYLDDVYDFYYEEHGRDSIDDTGIIMSATVRYCDRLYDCPLKNAFYDTYNDHMYFGEGYVVDDVVAHELTHGVTSYESNLIYAYESGAINEALSDIWGEFIDLTNGAGNDAPDVRWLIGEDVPDGGAIRDMQDPPAFSNWFPDSGEIPMPDRYHGPGWYYGLFDYGGVHHNMSVGTKIAYLLTDGDTFNGRTITPLDPDPETSLSKVADLFYEVQTRLLTPAADFHDLGMALYQASINQGYSLLVQENIAKAVMAVEIAQFPSHPAKHLRASSIEGDSRVILTWTNPFLSPGFHGSTLVRKEGSFPTSASDGTIVFQGMDTSFIDADPDLELGREYFYGLFVNLGDAATELFDSVIVGIPMPGPLSEPFSTGVTDPIDLAFSQLLFSPIADDVLPGGPGGPVGYGGYTATITHNVSDLPVPRQDAEGGAFYVPFTEDGSITGYDPVTPIPFFGADRWSLTLAANGYIAFQNVAPNVIENFPSLASHHEIPRISFLFADLAHSVAGEAWVKELDDRIVATFELVPEWPWYITYFPMPNTVQVELFFSGHIRVTYMCLNVEEAVVGLSDGKGVPPDPRVFLDTGLREPLIADLSELPAGLPSRLTIWPPVSIQRTREGDLVAFDVTTRGAAGIPTLSWTWDGPALAVGPLVDNGDGTAAFRWQTDNSSAGLYTGRVTAVYRDQAASQEVQIRVADVALLPQALELNLMAEPEMGDPFENRDVSSRAQLTAGYTYLHEQAADMPELYAEGPSQIRWFRNNALVAYLNNQQTLPSAVTTAGDRWFFTVIPETLLGVVGPETLSPVVTIVDPPLFERHDIVPAFGPVAGGTNVTITGSNLTGVLSVTFGGIRARSVRSISDSRIDVVTPAHAAGPVDVTVTTAKGEAAIERGFAYLADDALLAAADVDRNGVVDAADVQLTVNKILRLARESVDADVNRDGATNSADVQAVVNAAIY